MSARTLRVWVAMSESKQLATFEVNSGTSGTRSSAIASASGSESAESVTHQLVLVGDPIDAEAIRNELSLIRLQKSDLHKRIRAIRRAISALVQVFGPHILDDANDCPCVYPHNLSYRCPGTLDVCHEVLRESDAWLSLREILSLVEIRAPRLLGHYQNPSVSVSNALRTLQRYAAIQVYRDGNTAKWRYMHERDQHDT